MGLKRPRKRSGCRINFRADDFTDQIQFALAGLLRATGIETILEIRE